MYIYIYTYDTYVCEKQPNLCHFWKWNLSAFPKTKAWKLQLRKVLFMEEIWVLPADTVDGSEILRSPVEVGSLSHYLHGFSTIPGG